MCRGKQIPTIAQCMPRKYAPFEKRSAGKVPHSHIRMKIPPYQLRLRSCLPLPHTPGGVRRCLALRTAGGRSPTH